MDDQFNHWIASVRTEDYRHITGHRSCCLPGPLLPPIFLASSDAKSGCVAAAGLEVAAPDSSSLTEPSDEDSLTCLFAFGFEPVPNISSSDSSPSELEVSAVTCDTREQLSYKTKHGYICWSDNSAGISTLLGGYSCIDIHGEVALYL